MDKIEITQAYYKQISEELRAIGFELSLHRDGAWEKMFSDTFSMGVRILPSELQFYRWGDLRNDFSFRLRYGVIEEAISRIEEISTFTELDWIRRGKVLEQEIDELLAPAWKHQKARAQRFLYPPHLKRAQGVMVRLKRRTVEIRFI